MRRPACALWATLAILAIAAAPAAAANLSLNVGGAFVPFLSGEAGSGEAAPEYDDAFDEGMGISLEVAYRLNERFSLLAGLGYEKYSGNNYEGVAFDDLEIKPLFVGGKLHFAGEKAQLNPYLRADLGVVRLSSVGISYMGNSTAYWDGSWEFFCDFGVGVEYRLNALGFFAEVKARYLEKPDDALEYFSEADAVWSVPIVFGISWHF